MVLFQVLDGHTYDGTLYTWSVIGTTKLELGFLIDSLSALMMVVVTSVSLMVHIYTIGYMADDPGYQRFFSYISLFTFSMLMLVMRSEEHTSELQSLMRNSYDVFCLKTQR